MQTATPIIFLYPSTWETEPRAKHVAGLDLLRSAIDSATKDFGHISLHPVQINSRWSDHGMIEGQLLAEMQRSRWEYERLLYLRLPGVMVDVSSLDWALQVSDLRRYWAPLSSIASSPGSGTLESPPVLLWSSIRGLLTPRGGMRRLTTSMTGTHVRQHEEKPDVEGNTANKGTGWVVFDEAELEHNWSNEGRHDNDVVENFERSRRAICKGTGLLPD